MKTLTPHEVVARALAGDRAAGVVWDDALDALALAIANYTTLLAPLAGGHRRRAGRRRG